MLEERKTKKIQKTQKWLFFNLEYFLKFPALSSSFYICITSSPCKECGLESQLNFQELSLGNATRMIYFHLNLWSEKDLLRRKIHEKGIRVGIL